MSHHEGKRTADDCVEFLDAALLWNRKKTGSHTGSLPKHKVGKVCKKREKGRIVEVILQVAYGDIEEVMQLLGADSGGKINTSYIERLNLTIRNSLACFMRKSMNCSKILGRHTHAMDFFQAWYNFVKPHKSLRPRIDQGRKKWIQRTPAMAEGMTDHIWSIKELMTFTIPIQRFEYTTHIRISHQMSFPRHHH